MWWSRLGGSHKPRALAAVAAVAIVALAALTGCGFKPLYATGDDDETVTSDGLAATRIQPISGRTGQQLHNLLRDRLNPAGQSTQPAYVLTVSVSQTITELGIRKDETATRANLTLTAAFTLRDTKSNSVVLSSTSVSVVSYNILDALYATTVAEKDAVERGLRVLADDIRLRLAVYFADPGTVSRT